MSKIATFIKPLLPLLSAVYGLAVIYLTALPLADGSGSLAHEAMTWGLTLAAILLTVFVVIRIERRVYPESRQFSLKPPTLVVATGLLTRVGYQPTAAHPRQFNITRNGEFLLCCCRDSNKIQVFRRNKKTGALSDTGKDIPVSRAVCVQFL